MRFEIIGTQYAALEIPDEDWAQTPKSVQVAFLEQGRILNEQAKVIMAMVKTIAVLQKRLEILEEKLNTNSRNSGKPPSSDPPGTLPNRGKANTEKKSRGGQPGHAGHSRQLFPPSEVDKVFDRMPENCERCGFSLHDEASTNYIPHQFVELAVKLFDVFEYRRHSKKCPCCDEVTVGTLPEGISLRNFGPRLTETMSMMAGTYHMGRRSIVDFVYQILGIKISLGTVSSSEGLVGKALRPAMDELHELIQRVEAANADDTGWRESNKYACLWVVTSPKLTYYRITQDKTAATAETILGSFNGVLISDRGSNLKFYNGTRQTCWAHLDRHFVRMSERVGLSATIGLEAMKITDSVFAAWHKFTSDEIDHEEFLDQLDPLRKQLKVTLTRGTKCGHTKTENTCQNILDIYPTLWVFAYLDGVEPTNNAAELALRLGVLWRRTSYGSYSLRGCEFVASMLSVVATCKKQGRSVLNFIQDSLDAFLRNIPGPTLRPAQAPS